MLTWHEAYDLVRWVALGIAIVALVVSVADTSDCIATLRGVRQSGQNGWLLLRARARVEAALIRAGAHGALIAAALATLQVRNPNPANLPIATVRNGCVVAAMLLLSLATVHAWHRRRSITRTWLEGSDDGTH